MFNSCCKDRFDDLTHFIDSGCMALRHNEEALYAGLAAKVAEYEQKAEMGFFGIPGRVPESWYFGWIRELESYIPRVSEVFDEWLFLFYGFEIDDGVELH